MQRLFKTVKGSITVLVTLILVPTIFFYRVYGRSCKN